MIQDTRYKRENYNIQNPNSKQFTIYNTQSQNRNNFVYCYLGFVCNLVVVYCNLLVSRIVHHISIVVILTVIFGLLQTQDTQAALSDFLNFSNIPKHPLLETLEERNSTVNGQRVKKIIYRADEVDDYKLVNFYKDMLMQRGWKKSQEHFSPEYSVVGFTDDEMRVFTLTIVRSSLLKGVLVMVYYIPDGTKNWFFKENPEDNDMPGIDLDWLPRYPGSSRISSIEDYTGIITIQYLIPGYSCANCVAQFYKEQMLNNGWQLQGASYQDKDQIQQVKAKEKSGLEKAILLLKNTRLLNDEILKGFETFIAGGQETTQQPSEVHGLHFEKKGDLCAIGINYMEAPQAESNPTVKYVEESMNAHKKDNSLLIDGEPPEVYFSKIRPYYFQRLMEGETVTVSIVYRPKGTKYPENKLTKYINLGAK